MQEANLVKAAKANCASYGHFGHTTATMGTQAFLRRAGGRAGCELCDRLHEYKARTGHRATP